MAELFANNAVTSLTLSITASQTSIPVASNDGFPLITSPGDFFYVLIDSEIIRVDNNSTVLWTVTRGFQGTTATEHSAQATVYNIVTKKTMEDIIANSSGSVVSPSTFAALPSPGQTGNVYLLEDSYYPFVYDNGTNLIYFLNGRKVTRPPAASNWTVATNGNATLTDSKGGLYFGTNSNTQGAMEMAFLPTPTPPYTITFKILPQFLGGQSGQFAQYGILFSNSNTVSLTGCHVFSVYSTSNSNQFIVLEGATFTNNNFGGQANLVAYNQSTLWGHDFWMQMFDDNTNRGFRISRDGENFLPLQTVSRTLLFTPTHYGFYGRLGNVTGRPWGLTIPTMIQS
jgi:hypothetical protein